MYILISYYSLPSEQITDEDDLAYSIILSNSVDKLCGRNCS